MATDTSVIGAIAARYAVALYELADVAPTLDEVADELRALKGLIGDSANLAKLVHSPLIEPDAKAKAMETILAQAGTSDLVCRFVGVVADNNRLFALEAMIDAFLAELARRRGEVTAKVTSAHALSDAQLDELTRNLQASVGGNVSVDAEIDPDLIGGLIVRLGSRMIDTSLKTKLSRLHYAMKGAS